MTSLRVRFIRGEEVKYISHLDLMKTFERAMRRANIPLSYSKGFNPHPVMAFGLPLAVGVTSECEYMDLELDEKIEPEEFICLANSQLPPALQVKNACIRNDAQNIMASVAQAVYVVTICTKKVTGVKDIEEMIENIMNKSSIIVSKKGKKGSRDVDIRPLIRSIEVLLGNIEGEYEIKLTSAAGSSENLSPMLFAEFLMNYSEAFLTVKGIHRKELMVKSGVKLCEPMTACILGGEPNEGNSC